MHRAIEIIFFAYEPLVLIFSCLLQHVSLSFNWHIVLVVLITVGSSVLTSLNIWWEVVEDMRFEQVLLVTLDGSVGQLLHTLNYFWLMGILLLDAACRSTWFDLWLTNERCRSRGLWLLTKHRFSPWLLRCGLPKYWLRLLRLHRKLLSRRLLTNWLTCFELRLSKVSGGRWLERTSYLGFLLAEDWGGCCLLLLAKFRGVACSWGEHWSSGLLLLLRCKHGSFGLLIISHERVCHFEFI